MNKLRIDRFKERIRQYPTSSAVYFELGKLYHEIGSLKAFKNAFKCFCIATVLNSRNKEYQHFRRLTKTKLLKSLSQFELKNIEINTINCLSSEILLLAGLQQRRKKVEVVILTGFLGAGKTTLLNRILKQEIKQKIKFMVFVNDMSELNVDEILVKRNLASESDSFMQTAKESSSKESKTEIIDLSNGCICCSLRQDFFNQVLELLVKYPNIDKIFIEASGISELLPVAQTFLFTSQDNHSLRHVTEIKSLVSVIAMETLVNLKNVKFLSLIQQQLEFASTIIITKSEKFNEEFKKEARKCIQEINKTANVAFLAKKDILENDMFLNEVNVDEILRSHQFKKSLLEEKKLTESEEYNISSFIYKSSKRICKKNFVEVINKLLKPKCFILRAKGFISFEEEDNDDVDSKSRIIHISNQKLELTPSSFSEKDQPIEVVFICFKEVIDVVRESLKKM